MSSSVWIAIAVIAVLVVAALVLGLVLYRRRRISLDSSTAVERDTTKPIDRSGGYTASSGITFSQSAPPVAAPTEPPERIDTGGLPAVGDDATIPRDAPKRPIADVQLPEPAVQAPPEFQAEAPVERDVDTIAPAAPDRRHRITPAAPDVDTIAPPEGRLERLRGRLAKSQNALGRSMLGLLGAGISTRTRGRRSRTRC